MKEKYTREEIRYEMEILEHTFDIVRLVNPILGTVYKPDADLRIAESGCFCFEAWNKNMRCKNCISAMAFSGRERQSKLEQIGDRLFFVAARYVEVEGNAFVLETVCEMPHAYADKLLRDAEGELQDISALYRQAHIDELTGLYNRRYLHAEASRLYKKLQLVQRDMAMIEIDVDRLKSVNDALGHLAGDALITAASDAMHRLVPPGENFVARLGGDEFVMLVQDCSYPMLKSLCENLVTQLGRVSVKNYPQIKISVSIGGALLRETTDYEEWIALVDARLYKAKNAGRNTFVIR